MSVWSGERDPHEVSERNTTARMNRGLLHGEPANEKDPAKSCDRYIKEVWHERRWLKLSQGDVGESYSNRERGKEAYHGRVWNSSPRSDAHALFEGQSADADTPSRSGLRWC